MPWQSLFDTKNSQQKDDSAELVGNKQSVEERNAGQTQNVNELGEQNQDEPMSMDDMQNIMLFKFVAGRPIINFIIAVLWSIGLPILLFHLLRPRIGQVSGIII
jgi:hypothetical protein